MADAAAFAEWLTAAPGAVHFFPIRHHSPACAVQLGRAFDAIRPRLVLVELPHDFAPLLPLLTDAALRPPAAILSMRPAVAYWPMSATAPELAAIRWAGAAGVPVVCCDLAPADRLRQPAADAAPVVLADDGLINHSDYVQALVRRTGCRDFNEVWERMFESRIAEPDWRRFFADLGAYCLLARSTYGHDELAADGTLAREVFMAARLAEAIASDIRPIAVVTGGFHTPALVDPTPGQAKPAVPDSAGAKPYLVRFSHERLDQLNGYAAGMPAPHYWEGLHAAVVAGAADPFLDSAQQVVLDLAQQLRDGRPGLAPPLPALVEMLRHASALAALRGLPGPLRAEMLDAARACWVKDDDPRYGAPILEALAAALTGTGIGEVPAGAGSPPLVEAARRRARELGFAIADSVRRNRDLDIHRNQRHRDSSRFLHAMALLDAEFGRLEHGADYMADVDLDTLFEVWSYAWSPIVEARLIDAAVDGDTVESACVARLRRAAARLGEDGRGHDAGAASRLLLAAARAGLGGSAVGELLAVTAGEIAEDPDLARVAAALGDLLVLWRGRATLGLTGAAEILPALAACYRRAIHLVGSLNQTSDDRIVEAAQALAVLRDLVTVAPAGAAIDGSAFTEAVAGLVDRSLPPLLAGAVTALATQFGLVPLARLVERVAGGLAGAAVEPADRVAPLAGLLMVAPQLLYHSNGMVEAIDRALAGLEEERFIALLPHLREALTKLDPREADAVAGIVAAIHGLAAGAIDITAPLPLSEDDLAGNVARSHELRRILAADGLAHWLDEATA